MLYLFGDLPKALFIILSFLVVQNFMIPNGKDIYQDLGDKICLTSKLGYQMYIIQ